MTTPTFTLTALHCLFDTTVCVHSLYLYCIIIIIYYILHDYTYQICIHQDTILTATVCLSSITYTFKQINHNVFLLRLSMLSDNSKVTTCMQPLDYK